MKLGMRWDDDVSPIVAPFTGAWIEISSFPSPSIARVGVAPFTGAWIEIWTALAHKMALSGRTLHGCVD